jgi:hypothetical protein
MTSVLTADKWLYAKLTGDGTLIGLVGSRVYMEIAKEGEAFPLIVMQQLPSSGPLMGVGTAVIWFDELWLVKGINKSRSYSTLGTIIDRVRAVLHAASGTVSGYGTVVGCVEESSPVRYSELLEGVQYQHLGLRFRVWTQ